jgi:NTP pyrophosphatase (non-canonical NTP hydrolase)
MITREDIEDMTKITIPQTKMSNLQYSLWVEGKVMTTGNDRLIENVLGLVGEAGEIAEKVKKQIRDGKPVSGEAAIKELGDVIFYVVALANYFDSDLDEVLQKNVDKLNSREERGVLGGSGDNR